MEYYVYKNMELDNIVASDIKNLEAKTVWFGPHIHLLISDNTRTELIYSKVLESTLALEDYQLKDVQSSLNKDHVDVQSCPELDYVYHILINFQQDLDCLKLKVNKWIVA